MTAIDEHRWDDLEQYLHPDFLCHLLHTGESFSRTDWIQFNAGYPGFDRLRVEELVATETGAACRSHVTSHGKAGVQHFACASFAQVADGHILRLTEVWTDLGQQAPPATRTSATVSE